MPKFRKSDSVKFRFWQSARKIGAKIVFNKSLSQNPFAKFLESTFAKSSFAKFGLRNPLCRIYVAKLRALNSQNPTKRTPNYQNKASAPARLFLRQLFYFRAQILYRFYRVCLDEIFSIDDKRRDALHQRDFVTTPPLF